MEIMFHTGKSSTQSFKSFAEKRVDFLIHDLRELNAKELKTVLHILKEENRTFDKKHAVSYNADDEKTK